MLYILRSFMEHEPRAPSPHCNRNEKISKIKIGTNQMSSRHHMWRKLHRGNKKKLHNTKGRKREQVSQLRTSTSPFKILNSRMHMEHCVHRENHLSEEHNGRPANCLQETKPKQTSAFFPVSPKSGWLNGPEMIFCLKKSWMCSDL